MSLSQRVAISFGLLTLFPAITICGQGAGEGPAEALPVRAEAEDDDLRVPIPHVEVRGEGPIPMILIPDNGYDWSVFDQMMDELAADFTMYAVTLPGMVGTPAPEKVRNSDITDLHTLRNAIASVRQLIEERKLETPIILGHGMGGHLAAWIAAEYPEETRAAISIDGLPHLPMGDWSNPLEGPDRRLRIEQRIIAPHREMTPEEWEEQYRRQHFFWVTDANRATELADLILQTEQDVVVQYLSELFFSDLRETLTGNERPILFVAPAQINDDPAVIGFQWKLAMGDNPRNCTLFFIAECSHFAWEDDPWTVYAAIRDFAQNRNIENSRVGPGGARVINPELKE